MKTVRELIQTFPCAGRVEWIGASRASRSEILAIASAICEIGRGLQEDYHAKSGRSKRQVTLIQAEHLEVVARLMGKAAIDPTLLRRNIVVSGINLLALRSARFRIGEAELEGTGACDPCSRMEENLGPGGLNAMRGHGGITTRVIVGGVLRIGDAVTFLAS